MNNIRLIVLITIFTSMVLTAGYLIGGESGLIYALIFAFITNFISYFFSDKIVLMSSGGQIADPAKYDWLYTIVQNLTAKAGMKMPKIYIIPQAQPNAFATGRNQNNAVVGLNAGILQVLDREELEAVIAHELTHIKSKDILIGSVAAVLGSTISILANMLYFGMAGGRSSERERSPVFDLLFILFAPFVALLIQTAISRSREYNADKGAVELTDKQSMISALEKIHGIGKQIPADINPARAHMYIFNPLSGSWIRDILSTHPSLDKRISYIQGL